MIGVAGELVVFLEVGRVALRADVVPVLQRTGPVQRVVVRDRLLGIQVVPPLVFRVPGDG